MGSVWAATHLGLDIPCALKFIEGANSSNEDALVRFEREAKAAAQLRHPNVVQVMDHGVWEGTPYIAMELLEGEDLGQRLARTGPMSARAVYTLVYDVCRALAKAHATGIVHRDLKPENIFLVHDDEREIAKVLDFGIAKSSQMAGGRNTRTGALLGTPFYMSPEQARGANDVDHRSDLWSLAVICFQALTGHLPFECDALGALLMKIITEPIPLPSSHGTSLAGLDEWWLKASCRDVVGRFQSAKEFAGAFAVVAGVSFDGSALDSLRRVSKAPAAPAPPNVQTFAPSAVPSIAPDAKAAPSTTLRPIVAAGALILGLSVVVAAAAVLREPKSAPSPVVTSKASAATAPSYRAMPAVRTPALPSALPAPAVQDPAPLPAVSVTVDGRRRGPAAAPIGSARPPSPATQAETEPDFGF
jgi:serine/threonine-protein kinase